MADIVKVNLDRIAAQAVQQIALRENRSASNAASTLIREAILYRRNATVQRNDHHEADA